MAFDLTGPAESRGGIAQGPDNFILARSLPVECGVNRVFVRSTLQAGRVVLTARSAGLAPAKIELDAHAVQMTEGWSRVSSMAALKGRLDRGPTPGTPSFKATRNAVAATNVLAEDGGDPTLAFDDNEETSWFGKKPVTFELARVAQLSEITLKKPLAGSEARDAFGGITELVDQKNATTGEQNVSAGALGIIEIEFYEPAAP